MSLNVLDGVRMVPEFPQIFLSEFHLSCLLVYDSPLLDLPEEAWEARSSLKAMNVDLGVKA